MLQVLLVDDSRSDRFLLLGNLPERVFREARFDEAASMKQAQSYLRNKEYDVVVLDLTLPDSSGLETYFQARAAAEDTPIIILTGNDDEELAKQLVEHGADSYIMKGSTEPPQVYRHVVNVVLRSKTSVKLTEEAAVVTRKALQAGKLLKDSYSSGEVPAQREERTAEALTANTEMVALVLQKVDSVDRRVSGLEKRMDRESLKTDDRFNQLEQKTSDRTRKLFSDITGLKIGHEKQEVELDHIKKDVDKVDRALDNRLSDDRVSITGVQLLAEETKARAAVDAEKVKARTTIIVTVITVALSSPVVGYGLYYLMKWVLGW